MTVSICNVNVTCGVVIVRAAASCVIYVDFVYIFRVQF